MPFRDDGSWEPRPLRIGVTGHRKLGDHPGVEAVVRDASRRLLGAMAEVGRLNGGGIEAWSALAIGADTLFAEAALELELPLVGVVPFANYPRDFRGPERPIFDALLERCSRVVTLDRKRKTKHAYLEGGTCIVQSVDLLFAVWNGQPARALGGTGDVVAYAERRGVPVVCVDPASAGSAPK
ncbi:MAG: hypothetical protein AAF602_10045 [Myxococcota bacterium]